jgi:hypothetical protein
MINPAQSLLNWGAGATITESATLSPPIKVPSFSPPSLRVTATLQESSNFTQSVKISNRQTVESMNSSFIRGLLQFAAGFSQSVPRDGLNKRNEASN